MRVLSFHAVWQIWHRHFVFVKSTEIVSMLCQQNATMQDMMAVFISLLMMACLEDIPNSRNSSAAPSLLYLQLPFWNVCITNLLIFKLKIVTCVQSNMLESLLLYNLLGFIRLKILWMSFCMLYCSAGQHHRLRPSKCDHRHCMYNLLKLEDFLFFFFPFLNKHFIIQL